MTRVRIGSEGTLATTHVVLGEQYIPGERLVSLQFYIEPQIEQVGCELTFLDEAGKLLRWSGANTDDELRLALAFVDPVNLTHYAVDATRGRLRFTASGVPVFPAGTLIFQILADGWSVQANQFFRVTSPADYRALLEGKS